MEEDDDRMRRRRVADALEAAVTAAGGDAATEAVAYTAALQSLLAVGGYWTGPIDGQWTDALTAALKEAQADAGIVIPAYKGTADGWVKAFPEFNLQVFVDALENSTQYPSSLNSAAWQDPIELEFNKAWTGEVTVEDAAAKATTLMNDALAAEK